MGKISRAIVVATFSDRFYEFCIPLLSNLRAGGVKEPIYLVINADWSGGTDFAARSVFVSKVLAIENVFPICLGSPSGMSKIWNTGIRAAGADQTLILNDDTIVNQDSIQKVVEQVFASCYDHDLVIVNRTFGHFALTKKCLSAVGVFDERFLGFGEEDADYYWRYEAKFKCLPFHLDNIPGILNPSVESGHESLVKAEGASKYSLFNTIYQEEKYQNDLDSHRGMFRHPCRKILREPSVADIVDWEYRLNLMLYEANPEVIRERIRDYLASFDPYGELNL